MMSSELTGAPCNWPGAPGGGAPDVEREVRDLTFQEGLARVGRARTACQLDALAMAMARSCGRWS